MLETQGVCKKFGDIYAVHGVSLTIPAGQMVGIIGRSGAGKSTLLRLLNRLVDLTHGHITCDGIDVGSLKGRALHAWRAQCAMIFQQFLVWDPFRASWRLPSIRWARSANSSPK